MASSSTRRLSQSRKSWLAVPEYLGGSEEGGNATWQDPIGRAPVSARSARTDIGDESSVGGGQCRRFAGRIELPG
eukprot:575681-Prorocentrum_minimum.AAC.1